MAENTKRQSRKESRENMYETFEKLTVEKKDQIIQVCLEEFIENGYQNASTNTIVKRLGISKGVLFLYFKNKKNLYLYLVEHISKILIEYYFNKYTDGPLINIDIFDNLGDYYKELMQNKPTVFLFLMQAFLDTPKEIKEEVDARHKQSHERIFPHMIQSGFRQGIDIQLVDDLLHMVSYYVGQTIFNDLKGKGPLTTAGKELFNQNIDNYLNLFEKYVDVLKYGVYENPERT